MRKRQAKRKQDLSSEEIIAFPSNSKTSITDEKLVECRCYYHCAGIFSKAKNKSIAL